MLPNVVLFQAIDSTGTDSLWETNGTTSGTFELTSSGGPSVSGQAPITGEAIFGFAPDPEVSIDLTVFNNQALFIGRIGPGDTGPFELWTTDGTAAGTVELTVAGANSAGLFTATTSPDFTVFDDEVLFNGRTPPAIKACGRQTEPGPGPRR
jgi:ELWxxDGT repeat protein